MNREALSALRDKYREMQRLRDEDAAGAARDPKPAMAALAARFPGALRQIDRMSTEEMATRLAALDDVIEGRRASPEWARWEVAYHGRMRATLRVKRAVRVARDDDHALVLATNAWALAADEPKEEMTFERLRGIRKPEGGRLNPVVLAAVAVEHGVSVEEVRKVLFPPVALSGGDDA
jgi:hypothetical protein